MTSLYEISHEYRLSVEKLADLDLDAQTIADTLEGMGGELETKAQNVIFFVRNLETTAAQIKEAEASMAARRKAIENRAEGLKRYVLGSMQHAGIEKIECPYFRLSVRDNPPAVEVFEPGLIPADYMTVPVTPLPVPDKAAIKAAIKAGKEVPGAKLVSGVRLDIK